MSASGFIVLRPFCPGLHAYARNALLLQRDYRAQKKRRAVALRFLGTSVTNYCFAAGASDFASLFGAAEPPAEADSPPLTPSAAMVCWSSWPEAFRPLEVWNSLTAFW